MPGIGLDQPVVGYATFTAIKFAGYSLAAAAISRSYGRRDLSSLLVGGVRTVIGMAAGAAYFGLALSMPQPTGDSGPILYLAGLVPVRLLEWWLIVWLFYIRRGATARAATAAPTREIGAFHHLAVIVCGTIWSYALDVPALAGLLFTGGFSVC